MIDVRPRCRRTALRLTDSVAAVGFYKAVHIVEAAFAADLHCDSTSHANREKTLKNKKFQGIFKDYTHLNAASRIARYLEAEGKGKFSTFTDYLDNAGVKSLMEKRLYGVDQRSRAFLTGGGRLALLKGGAGQAVANQSVSRSP